MKKRTYIATPPGATIREQLIDRGMSQKEFAARMDMSEKHISRLINGDVQLTPEMAVRLETVLGVPAAFWNKLEAVYREKLIKAETENAMDADAEIAERFPYDEMAGLGWVPEARDGKEKAVSLRRFFGVVRLPLLEDEQIMRIACRRLTLAEKGDLAAMAWAQEAKILSRHVQTPPADVKRLLAAVPKIQGMGVLASEEICPRLAAFLAGFGVTLVFLPRLTDLSLQGVTLTEGNRIILGLPAGETGSSEFWSSLFRELAHVALGHLGKPGGLSATDEKDADEWACDALSEMKRE